MLCQRNVGAGPLARKAVADVNCFSFMPMIVEK
jgi:hypothetical protein